MVTASTAFEQESCSRCGGSGKYSYCQMYGDRCFKCAGTGKQLTKKGHAALLWLRASRKALASEIQPGDRVRSGGLTFTVGSVYQDLRSSCTGTTNGVATVYPPFLHFRTRDDQNGFACVPETVVERLGRTVADRNAELLKAFAYQDTLTKAGKPRKR